MPTWPTRISLPDSSRLRSTVVFHSLYKTFSTSLPNLKCPKLIGIPPLPGRLPVLPPLTALSTSQPVTTFVSYQRQMRRRARSAQDEPNLLCISLSLCAYFSLNPLSCLGNWFTPGSEFWLIERDCFSLVIAIYMICWLLIPWVIFKRNAALSIYHQLSLPSYSNLYLWNRFTLSESIPFLINQLTIDLYSGQRVNLSNISCFNVLSRAEMGPWQWLSRHSSFTQMNCSETELTTSLFQPMFILALGF